MEPIGGRSGTVVEDFNNEFDADTSLRRNITNTVTNNSEFSSKPEPDEDMRGRGRGETLADFKNPYENEDEKDDWEDGGDSRR